MAESIADVVVISHFHNEYDGGLEERARNFAVLAEMEAQFAPEDAPVVPKSRRVGTIAVSEAALELAQDGIEYAATPEKIMHVGTQLLAKILVGDSIGIRLVAEDQDGRTTRLKFRQKSEEDGDGIRGGLSGTDLIGGVLGAIDEELANRVDFYTDLAGLEGEDTGLQVAQHLIAVSPETEVAIAAGRVVFNAGTSTDFINNGIQVFAALDRMQRSGVKLRFYDALGNSSELRPLRPMAIGPGEAQNQQCDALSIAQTFIDKLKVSGMFDQYHAYDEFEQILVAQGLAVRPRQFKKLFAEPGSEEISGYGYDTPKDVIRAVLEDIFVGSTIQGDAETAGIAYALHGQLMKDDGRPLRQGYRLLQALSYARKAEVQYGNKLEGDGQKAAYERAINCTIEINSHLRELKTTWPEMQGYLERDSILPSIWSEQLEWEKERRIHWIAWGPSAAA